MPTLTILGKKPFENFVGRCENAGDFVFPQCSLPRQRRNAKLLSTKCFQFGQG